MRTFVMILTAVLTGGCLGVPDGIEPVKDFQVSRYMGRWYEIARLDHSFERGLSHVTAEYRLNDDGSVQVTNRGWSAADGQWRQARGIAHFVGDADVGLLKVSFFRPFYGAYVIFELDTADYGYAFVTSSSRSYLWLLSRAPTVDPAVMNRFIDRSRSLGFDTDALIVVDHSDQSQ